MNAVSSRKNAIVTHLRRLGKERDYREKCQEYLCDGLKLLKEAVLWNAEIVYVACCGNIPFAVPCNNIFTVSPDILQYISPMKTPSQVVFSVKMKNDDICIPKSAILLETVQDPGNLGTILRTANAFEVDLVVMCGECADVYNPKTVRASMGAIFRQRFLEISINQISAFFRSCNLTLYGTALSGDSVDIRNISMDGVAVAIGSEGKGLSAEVLSICEKLIVIPMSEQCESLNAAVASAIVMWELNKNIIGRI